MEEVKKAGIPALAAKLPAYMLELDPFPFLTQVRFFAAMVVLCHHIERYKECLKHDVNIFFEHWTGQAAVDLFFVISGFLITYLLLKEKEKRGEISIKKFYVRRILRIWPLYFLIVFFTFFILPNLLNLSVLNSDLIIFQATYLREHFWRVLLLYCFFLPVAWPEVLGASQAWSIGVEEQFYLLWPWLVKFGRKYIHWLILLIVLIKLGFAYYVLAYWPMKEPHMTKEQFAYYDLWRTFVMMTRMEMMAAGGLAACLYVHLKGNVPAWIRHPLSQAVSVSLIALVLFRPNVLIEPVLATGFAHIILANLKPPGTVGAVGLVINYLGRISYGIYMYHCLVELLAIQWLQSINGNMIGFDVILYILSIGGTLLVSAASYHYFERPFLRLKNKFIAY